MTLMSGAEIGATGNEKMKLSLSLSLPRMTSFSTVWVKSETGASTESCVFSLINTERSRGGWKIFSQEWTVGFGFEEAAVSYALFNFI